MDTIVLTEASRRSIRLNKLVDFNISWDSSILTVLTDKGIQAWEITHNVSNYTKNICMNVSCIACSKTIPCATVFPPNFISKGVSNQVYNQCLLDPNLWPHDVNYAKEMISIDQYQWSKSNFIQNNKPALAILSNIGSVELFTKTRLGYESALLLTDLIEQQYKNNRKECDKDDIETYRSTCKSIFSSTLCWGPNEDRRGSYLITAQRNGDLLAWRVLSNENCLTAHLLGKIYSFEDIVVKVVWVTNSSIEHVLLCSLLNGEMYAMSFNISDSSVQMSKINCVWKYKDKTPSNYIECAVDDGNIVIFCTKHRHVLALLLDQQFNVIHYALNNINNYKIVGLYCGNGDYVVGTFNCQLYSLKYVIKENKINISSVSLEIKEKFDNFNLTGFGISPNCVLWALCLYSNKIDCNKKHKSFEISFIHLGENNNTEVNLLINNPMQKLTNMSDCMELLKYKSNKFKTLPDIDYSKLFTEANDSIYKLKLYLMLLILYKNRVYNSHKRNNYDFPETSVSMIKDKIFMKHSISLLRNIMNLYKQTGKLTDHQKEVYFCSKLNLNTYCEKYKINLSSLLKDDILNINNDLKYVCQCCDEPLLGFTCRNKHINQFCSVTFTPISDSDYLACDGCGLIARQELYPENPTCTLCDSPLQKFVIY